MMLPFFPQTVGHGAGLHGTNSAGASTPILLPPARSRWWSPKDGCPHAPQKLSATVLKSTAGTDIPGYEASGGPGSPVCSVSLRCVPEDGLDEARLAAQLAPGG